MTVYFPYEAFASRTLYGVVRGREASGLVNDAVRVLDPQVPVYDLRSMESRVSDSFARERVLMTLLLLFGGVAVALATVGLYAVLAFTVATHTRELGIRKAVGATRADLYRLIFGGAARTVVIGIVLGLVVVLSASRLIGSLLYGVEATDPLSLAGASAFLLALGLAASYLPARRAAEVDPVVALKE